jgi:hypothetical protein
MPPGRKFWAKGIGAVSDVEAVEIRDSIVGLVVKIEAAMEDAASVGPLDALEAVGGVDGVEDMVHYLKMASICI